jgi:hypothetical protein
MLFLADDVFADMLLYFDLTSLGNNLLVNKSWFNFIVNNERVWKALVSHYFLKTNTFVIDDDDDVNVNVNVNVRTNTSQWYQQMKSQVNIRFVNKLLSDNVETHDRSWKTFRTNKRIVLKDNVGVTYCLKYTRLSVPDSVANYYGAVPGIAWKTTTVQQNPHYYHNRHNINQISRTIGTGHYEIGFGLDNGGFHNSNIYHASALGNGEYLSPNYKMNPDDSLIIQLRIGENEQFNIDFYLVLKTEDYKPILLQPHVKDINAEYIVPCLSLFGDEHVSIRCIPAIQ